jgi:hypothetical protein
MYNNYNNSVLGVRKKHNIVITCIKGWTSNFLLEILKERDHFGEVNADEKIILK